MAELSKDVRADLALRFDHHPPATDAVAVAHQRARAEIKRAATALHRIVPAGNRDHSLMLTALEDALMRANAAIAKHHPDNTSPMGAP